jgi:peptidoglycan/xylan/chitin deacetylase (PgdA/CDA1 family)
VSGQRLSRARGVARHALAALLQGSGLTRPGRRRRDHLLVATFHRVLPEPLRREYPMPWLAVTPEELEWFLKYFARHYACGSLREAADAWEQGERRERPWLAITFDDGQLDNHRYARPVLARAGLRASFYVPTDRIGSREPLWHDRVAWTFLRLCAARDAAAADLVRQVVPRRRPGATAPAGVSAALAGAKALEPALRERWLARAEALVGATRPDWDALMGWDQLRELARDGHEIGSHSASHALLPQLGDAELERETQGSRQVLESRLDVPVDSFCYPNGDWDDRSVVAVRKAGYRRAVTTRWGSNAPGAAPFTLRRCDMDAEPVLGAGGRPAETLLAWRLSGLHPRLR